jgi:IS4 transposase
MKKFKIVFVDKDFSRFATFPLIGSFLNDYLNINGRLQILSTKKRKIVFSRVDYCLTLISCIFLGIKNLNNIDDCLQTENKLAGLLGIEAGAFPKKTACRDFLTSCTHWNVKQIDKISFDLVKEHSAIHKKKKLIIDIDQTTKSTEGIKIERAKPGYNTKRKGRCCLKYSISTVNGYIFSKRLESGNTHCSTNFKAIYSNTKKKIDQIPEIGNQKIILRIDGGYFSRETLKLIENEQIGFVTKGKINLVSIKELIRDNKENWQPLKANVKHLYFKGQKVYADWPVKYNILIIREMQKRLKSRNRQVYHTIKEITYALITNLDYSPKRLWRFYKGRQTIENCFKEHNQSFKAGKLPTHKFYGNAFYYELVCLCYNISFF